MSKRQINYEAWACNAIGFIRERGLEQEHKDWSGGWPCPVRSANVSDIVAEMEKALQAASGYLLNAKIDLETGASKKTAITTIEGGLKVVREAIARATQGSPQ